MYYVADSNLAFSAVQYIMYEVNYGLFIVSYRLSGVWVTGLVMFLVVIAQIRFWAAVVITSLLSVIPYIGNSLVI
ncbi:hypothetical protein COOONC_07031 [Cooperia oncophora]